MGMRIDAVNGHGGFIVGRGAGGGGGSNAPRQIDGDGCTTQ